MIRVATIEDVEIIVKYNVLLAKETENIDLNVDIVRKGVTNLINDKSKGSYFLYVKENQVIGQTMVTYEWSDWRNKNFWWIQSVYVNKDNRNQKVFKNIFNYIFSLAKDMDTCGIKLYVDENNQVAQDIYNSLGLKSSHYNLYEIYF